MLTKVVIYDNYKSDFISKEIKDYIKINPTFRGLLIV